MQHDGNHLSEFVFCIDRPFNFLFHIAEVHCCVNYNSNLRYVPSLNNHRQGDIKFVRYLLTGLGVHNYHMASTTLAHALTNHRVVQCGHLNAPTTDMWHNWYTDCILTIYVIKIDYLGMYYSYYAGAINIISCKSDSCMLLS